MGQERCVLPVKCRECGAVFDLWYDLQAQEQLRRGVVMRGQAVVALQKRAMKLLERQSLCWECRKSVVETPFEKEVEEYNLLLDFE